MESRGTRWALGGWTALVMLFLWVPLALIMVYAFNKSNVQSWPIPGFTTHWFSVAWHTQEVRDAIWLSVRAALVATGDRDGARLGGRVRDRALLASSAATRSRSCSCCRSRCPGSSPAWR